MTYATISATRQSRPEACGEYWMFTIKFYYSPRDELTACQQTMQATELLVNVMAWHIGACCWDFTCINEIKCSKIGMYATKSKRFNAIVIVGIVIVLAVVVVVIIVATLTAFSARWHKTSNKFTAQSAGINERQRNRSTALSSQALRQ